MPAIGEPVYWVDDFYPAISTQPRDPLWNVLRYNYASERVLFRLLQHVGMEYKHLTYLRRVPRSRPVPHPWLPGYLFLHFDTERDRWQQIARMPGAIEFLGALEPGVMEDFVARLPDKLVRPAALSCIAPGTIVRIQRGMFADHVGPVMWSNHHKVRIPLMVFNRPTDVEIERKDVEIVRK